MNQYSNRIKMSLYYLQGYRSFKSENEIKQIAWDFMNEFRQDLTNTHLLDEDLKNKFGSKSTLVRMKLHALKIFQTSRQQTWIVAGYGYIFCLLDDIKVDIHKSFDLIRWYAEVDKIKDKITVTPSSNNENFGLVNFGESHKNWYYSKNLLTDEKMAQRFINAVVVSGSTVG